MSTAINITVDDGGLPARNRQQVAANRQAFVQNVATEKSTALGVDKRSQDRIAQGRDPVTGAPLIPPTSTGTLGASGGNIPRLNQQPAANRQAGVPIIEFLPPTFNGSQFKPVNGSTTAVKWWRVKTDSRFGAIAMEEEPELVFPGQGSRRFLSVSNNLMYLDTSLMPSAVFNQQNIRSVSGQVLSNNFRCPIKFGKIVFNCSVVAPTGVGTTEPGSVNGGNSAAASVNFGVFAVEVGGRRIFIGARSPRPNLLLPVNQGAKYNVSVEATKESNSIAYTINGKSYSFIDSVSIEEMFAEGRFYSISGFAGALTQRFTANDQFPPVPTTSGSFGNIKIRFI